MKYNWIIFDADGTLLDYDAAESNAIATTFSQFSINLSNDVINLYRTINESLFQSFENGDIIFDELKMERFSLLFQKFAISVDVESFSEVYLQKLSLDSQLVTDAEKVISKLFGKVNMIILTNGNASVQRPRLQNSSIGAYFKDIVISEEEGYAKPAIEIFDVAFMRMNYPSLNEILIVGDSLTSDIAGGNN